MYLARFLIIMVLLYYVGFIVYIVVLLAYLLTWNISVFTRTFFR